MVLAIVNVCLVYLPTSYLRVLLLRSIGQRIDSSASIHRGLRIMSLRPGSLRIGKRAIVNHSVLLDNRRGLVLQDDVAISSGGAIYTLSHDHSKIDRPTLGKPVVIGKGSFLYSRVIVCPGVRIRKQTVLAAGCVLTRSTGSNSLWGGNPARCIKSRYSVDAVNSPYKYFLAP